MSRGEQQTGDDEVLARAVVLRQLTMAPRSRAQLAAKLAGRGVSDDVALRVLDRFEQVGLVDDAAFAQGWVRSRQTGAGLGRRALAYELRAKGVDEQVVEQALESVDDDVQRRTARQLVARRIQSMRGLARDKQVSRLSGLLARKGYGTALTIEVVREALACDDPRDDPCGAACDEAGDDACDDVSG